MRPFGQSVSLSRSLISIIIIIGFVGCLQEAPAPSPERTLTVLKTLLQDKNTDVRRTAVESLGKIGDRSAVAEVLPLLSDEAPFVRAAAAKALGRMGSASDEAIVVGLLRSLGDPAGIVRLAAAIAIGDIEPSSRQVADIVPLLQASKVDVRRAAVRALLSLDTSPFVPALLRLLSDPDVEVRQGAVAALGASGDPRAAMALQQRLAEDSSAAVRTEAAYHVGKFTGVDARPALKAAALRERDHGVRRWIEAELTSLRGSD
jgi:HEAT repeat protein